MVYRPCTKKIKRFWGNVDMIVSKDNLKKKLLKYYEDDETKKKCCICRQVIEKEDILNLRFEYCKSKINENWSHSKCANELIKQK